jgi:hypothetical protein
LRSREVARSTGARIRCRIQCARRRYRRCARGSARSSLHLPEASRRVSCCRAQAAQWLRCVRADEVRLHLAAATNRARRRASKDCLVVRVRRWIGRGRVTDYATGTDVAVDWDGSISTQVSSVVERGGGGLIRLNQASIARRRCAMALQKQRTPKQRRLPSHLLTLTHSGWSPRYFGMYGLHKLVPITGIIGSGKWPFTGDRISWSSVAQ